MRDAKLIFRYEEAPTVAGETLDLTSTQPAAASCIPHYSATYSGDAQTVAGTVTLMTSDEENGTFVAVAAFTVQPEDFITGHVLITAGLPSKTKRWLRATWTGITTGLITDGIDLGLDDGTAATQPYLA